MVAPVICSPKWPTTVPFETVNNAPAVRDSTARRLAGDVVPMPTLLAKYAVPVVVALPEIVSPPDAVPFPIVVDANAVRPPAKLEAVVDVAVKNPAIAWLPRVDVP